jgi:MerR family redox-sensitive transcriptional activator SoxR
MEKLTIGEVAEITGVATSTLRYYESIGIIPPPKRASGQRRYDPDVLQILAVVQLGKDVGFSLPEIKQLLYGFPEDMSPSARWRSLAQRKIAEIDQIIASATNMKRLLEAGLACEYLQLELDSIEILKQPRHH